MTIFKFLYHNMCAMHFEVLEKRGVYAFGGWQYIYNACPCVNLGSGS